MNHIYNYSKAYDKHLRRVVVSAWSSVAIAVVDGRTSVVVIVVRPNGQALPSPSLMADERSCHCRVSTWSSVAIAVVDGRRA